MARIPIGKVVGEAYAFAFGRYLTVLSVVWLPLLLLCAAAFFSIVPFFGVFLQMMHEAARHAASGDTSGPVYSPETLQTLMRMRGLNFLFNLAQLAFFAIVTVGITKEALGLRTGFRPVYISWGRDELLVAGAFFLVFVLLIIFIIVAAIVGGIVGGVGAVAIHGSSGSWISGGVGAGLLVALLVLIAMCVLIYLAVRLMFFVVPITVAEREFGVFRSWELSKGQFWPIFAILFLSWVPAAVAIDIVWSAAFWFLAFPPIMSAIKGFQAHDPAAAAAVVDQIVISVKANWPWLLALYLIPLPVMNGLMFSPAAFAYRELKPAEAAATASSPA